jgi:DNA recombination protein RmuC
MERGGGAVMLETMPTTPAEQLLIIVPLFLAGVALGWVLASRAAASLRSERDRAGAERDSALRERERLERELREEREQATGLRRSQAEVETRLEEAKKMQSFLQESRSQLEAVYAQLSQKALKEAVESLQQQIAPHLQKTSGEIVSSLDTKKVEIEALLTPVREMLEKYRDELLSSEKTRISAYGGIQEQIIQMMEAQKMLRDETSRLNTALEAPNIQGSWGENTLRRCVELAGMSEYCDFDLQMTFENEEGGRLRPDMVVNLPDDRVIAVDAKVPLNAYKSAATESDEAKRKQLLAQHAMNVRSHITLLSRKEYQESIGRQIRKTLDFTILFVGGEHFLSSAMITDQSIWDYAASRKIVLASPTILVPLLQALGTGWKAEKMEANAQNALSLATELYERFCRFFDLIEAVGKGLDSATARYNEAIRSFDQRLEPTGRRLREVVDSRRELPGLEQVEQSILQSGKLPAVGGGELDDGIDPEN